MLRVYAAADGDGYAVMPGGLTRVADATDVARRVDAARRRQQGHLGPRRTGRSRRCRCWRRRAARSRSIARRQATCSSRVADNLFWLGRYAERCEDLVRVFRAATSRLVEAASIDDAPELAAMVRAMATLKLLPAEAPASGSIAELEAQVLAALLAEDRQPGLRDTLGQLRHVAWLVRDRLSGDAWRILNQLHQDLRGDVACERAGDALVLLNRIVMTLAAFSGVEAENMTRGHGWRFLSAGRRLERGATLATLVRAMLPPRGRRHRRAVAAARDRRQQHDLPAALLRPGQPGAGAGPARRRRQRAALARLPAAGAGGARRRPAARSRRAGADPRAGAGDASPDRDPGART